MLEVPAPGDDGLQALLQRIIGRLIRLLTLSGPRRRLGVRMSDRCPLHVSQFRRANVGSGSRTPVRSEREKSLAGLCCSHLNLDARDCRRRQLQRIAVARAARRSMSAICCRRHRARKSERREPVCSCRSARVRVSPQMAQGRYRCGGQPTLARLRAVSGQRLSSAVRPSRPCRDQWTTKG